MSSGGGYSGGMGGYGGGFGQPPMFGGGFGGGFGQPPQFGGGFGGGFGQPPQYGGGFGSPYGGFGGDFGQPQQFGGGFGLNQMLPGPPGGSNPEFGITYGAGMHRGQTGPGNAYAQRFQKPSVGMFPPTSPQPNQPPPGMELNPNYRPSNRLTDDMLPSDLEYRPIQAGGGADRPPPGMELNPDYTPPGMAGTADRPRGRFRPIQQPQPQTGGDIQYAGGSPGFYEAQLQAQQRQGGQGYGNPFGGGFGGGFNPYMASSLIAGLGGMFGGYQAMPFGGFRPNEPFDFSGQQNPQQNAPTAAQQNTSYTPSADKQREDEILQRSYTNPSSITPEDRAFLTQQDEKAAAERGARFGLSPEQNKIREAGLANAGVQRIMSPESSPYLRTPFSLFDPRANSQFNSFDPQSQLNMQAKIAASNQRYIEVDDPSPTGQHGAGLKKYVLAPQ